MMGTATTPLYRQYWLARPYLKGAARRLGWMASQDSPMLRLSCHFVWLRIRDRGAR